MTVGANHRLAPKIATWSHIRLNTRFEVRHNYVVVPGIRDPTAFYGDGKAEKWHYRRIGPEGSGYIAKKCDCLTGLEILANDRGRRQAAAPLVAKRGEHTQQCVAAIGAEQTVRNRIRSA